MVMMSVFVPLFAFASAEGAAEAAQTALSVGDGLKYLGAALATGLATIGTGTVSYTHLLRYGSQAHENTLLHGSSRLLPYRRRLSCPSCLSSDRHLGTATAYSIYLLKSQVYRSMVTHSGKSDKLSI